MGRHKPKGCLSNHVRSQLSSILCRIHRPTSDQTHHTSSLYRIDLEIFSIIAEKAEIQQTDIAGSALERRSQNHWRAIRESLKPEARDVVCWLVAQHQILDDHRRSRTETETVAAETCCNHKAG